MNTKQRITSLSVILLTSISTHAATVTWTAASGLFPDQITPAYTLIDTAVTKNPVLSSFLTLSTDVQSESMYYVMSGADITMPANLVIGFSTRFISGTSAASYRAPITISFVTQPNIGGGLHIGLDSVFLQSSPSTTGESSTVDTDGAFHDYRIEVAGTGAGSAIKVFQDNAQILNGQTYNDGGIGHFGSVPQIAWGEASAFTSGVMEFGSFTHNAATVPEPTSAALLLCGAALCLRRRSLRTHERNG